MAIFHRCKTQYQGGMTQYETTTHLQKRTQTRGTNDDSKWHYQYGQSGGQRDGRQPGTEAMTGVSIVGQLIFVFNLAIFGGLSGPGIYGAQYYGQNNLNGFRNAVRMKQWISFFCLLAGLAVFAGRRKSDRAVSARRECRR